MGIAWYTNENHIRTPERVLATEEQFLLRLGAALALARLKKLRVRPLTETYAVHTLLSHGDIHRYIISIYSLLRFLSRLPQLVIYDDGTLTGQDRRLLSTIPHMTVLSACEIEKWFGLSYRRGSIVAQYRVSIIRTRKIIDLVFLKTGQKKILLLDSDVGFFAYPKKIVDFLDNRETETKILYLSDMQNAYATTLKNLKHIYGVTVTPRVNCGLLGVTPNIISKRFIKYFFTRLDRYKYTYPYFSEWVDQTPWAVLTKLHASKRLSSLYYIGMKETPPGVICRHYVHGSRSYFIKDMLRLIDNPQP